jgi:hypothetical protein
LHDRVEVAAQRALQPLFSDGCTRPLRLGAQDRLFERRA